MLRSLLAVVAALALQAQALSLQLEKNVAKSTIVGAPSVVTYKIYATPAAAVPVTQQAFAAGTWEADYDFTHFKTLIQDIVRFRALFTNTAALDPTATYYYEIELDGVVKGAREALNNEAWLYHKEEGSTFTTALQLTCLCQATLPAGVYTRLGDIGTFTKRSATSLIELDYSGTIYSASFTGNAVRFEFRIDNNPTAKGTMRAVSHDAGNYEGVSAGGVFPNLAVGTHTVSIWALPTNNGTAGQTCIDPGCFSSDQVIVKEYSGR